MSSDRVFALPKSSADKSKVVDPRDAAIYADEQARARVIRWLVAIYCFGAIIGIVFMLIGVIASAWYTSDVSVEQSPTSQGTITFNEQWRMATTGISVLTKFCSTKGGCLVDRDLFIFFDRASNEGFDWPDRFSPAVEDAHSGGQTSILLVSLATVLMLLCVVIILVGRIFPLATWLRWCLFGATILASLFGVLGAYSFYASVQDLLTLIESESPLLNTDPVMKLGWTGILAFAGPCVLFCMLPPFWKAVNPLAGWSSSGDLTVNQERAIRMKNYREDMWNTSHDVEQHPVDTASSGYKTGGWTKSIVSLSANKVVQLGDDGDVFNAPSEVIANRIDTSGYEAKMKRTMSAVMPSLGIAGKNRENVDSLTLAKAASFAGASSIPGFGQASIPGAADPEPTMLSRTNSATPGQTQLGRTQSRLGRTKSNLGEPQLGRTKSSLGELQLGRTKSSLGEPQLARTKSNLSQQAQPIRSIYPDSGFGKAQTLPSQQGSVLEELARTHSHLALAATQAKLARTNSNVDVTQLSGASERVRKVTRAPQGDRPRIEGFVSSKGPPPGQTKKKLQAAVVVTRDVAR